MFAELSNAPIVIAGRSVPLPTRAALAGHMARWSESDKQLVLANARMVGMLPADQLKALNAHDLESGSLSYLVRCISRPDRAQELIDACAGQPIELAAETAVAAAFALCGVKLDAEGQENPPKPAGT